MTLEKIPRLRLGTSSWSSQDWLGPFYPSGTPPASFLAEYAKHFDTVEVDSSFYRTPSAAMVRNWRERTPPGFLFAAKVPRVITHEKVLLDCGAELKDFLATMDLLGEKLGPLLLQFPYFNKRAFARPEDFLARLKPFLAQLPSGTSFAVEVRNKNFLGEPLIDLLRRRGIALALIDHPWMLSIGEMAKRFDLQTAEFSYLRFLGDRKGIEAKTQHWDKVIVNRQREMEVWVPEIRRMLERQRMVYAYFNNHYAGFAPGSLELFHKVWNQLSPCS